MSGDWSPGGGQQRREGVRQEPTAGGEGGGQHCPGGTRGLHVHREGPSTSGIVLLKVVGHNVGDPEPDPQDPHVFWASRIREIFPGNFSKKLDF